ncbi:MAG TPA: protein kinase [Gemmatimonadaceae bacterium]|nr:protein kinase [Gemmatimonadaceae bacterium]
MTPPALSTAGTASLSTRYALERELGAGGMATVYLAEEKKHGRKVAIKILRAELAASVGAERFLREIGIAARLSHPHIVPLIDSGDADGVLYYVSPFIPGGSLRDRLDRERRLGVREAIHIAQEVGAGLDYAHREGIVHRDVKPENILFADGHALLADFGVARARYVTGADDVTGAGIALGTPEYMSPEQASGDRDIDARSDVYSLACVLYEMLAGSPPMRGDSPRGTMAKHVTEVPRPVRVTRPEVPAVVEEALARALAKDPLLRHRTVADFCAALEADAPVQGRLFDAAARSIAVLPFVNASPDPENEYLSDGITDELIDALAKVDGLRVASRTSVFALKNKPQDVRAIGALLGASVVLEGTVRKSGSQLRVTAQLTSTDDGRLLWSHRFDRTLEDVFALQDEIARTIVDTLRAKSFADLATPAPTHHTESVIAYGLYLRGRHAWNRRTQEGVSEAIEYFERAIAEDSRYALAYTGLSDAYALHVDYRSVPVHEGFARAKEYARRALDLNERVAEAHNSLGWVLFIYDWEWEAAEREFRRSIELDPRYATSHQWYAMFLASQCRTQEALIEGHTAQELDPASVSIRRSLGWLYFYARRFDQARYHLERAVTMQPAAEETHRMLGLALAFDGRLTDAERVLRDAMDLPAASTYLLATLGYVLGRTGNRDDAERIVDELTSRAQQGYVSPVSFAMAFLGVGSFDRALEWAERAFDDRRGWLAYLAVNPLFDSVREHPRFANLVRQMRLETPASSAAVLSSLDR